MDSITSNQPIAYGGAWNEAGLIRSLDRKGFTHVKAGSEAIANSWDAGSRQIIFKIITKAGRRKIQLIDFGRGMDLNDLKNMFDIHRANNENKQSMGVSGLGGKEASYILSKNKNTPTNVEYYTRKSDGIYYKVVVPWKQIFDNLVYTDKIEYYHMTEDEQNKFIEERESQQCDCGTTIEWEYSEEFKELLDNQFDEDLLKSEVTFKDRWDIIFGLTGMKIVFDKGDGASPKDLNQYNYFSGENIDYYNGKQIKTIEHYHDAMKNDHYVWYDGQQYGEFTRNGRGTSKLLQPCDPKRSGWTLISEFFVYLGLRKNTTLFDEEKPKMPSSATLFLCNYDEQFFNINGQRDMIRNELAKVGVVRNEQFITNFQLDGINNATARANSMLALKIFHIRCEVRYNTISRQDNATDIAMGIQENKNQNQDTFPLSFVRLVTYLKDEFYKSIVRHFEDVCNQHKPKPKPKPTPKPPAPSLAQVLIIESDNEDDDDDVSSISTISTSSGSLNVPLENPPLPTPIESQQEPEQEPESVLLQQPEPTVNYGDILLIEINNILLQGNQEIIKEVLDFVRNKNCTK